MSPRRAALTAWWSARRHVGLACVASLQAEHIVEAGELQPDEIHLSGVFVDRVVQSTVEKKIEFLTLTEDGADSAPAALDPVRGRIVKRASHELQNGMCVVVTN